MTATAEQPPIGRGGGRRRSDRCRGDDRRRDAYDDHAYRGAGKDDEPLDKEEEDQEDGYRCCIVR